VAPKGRYPLLSQVTDPVAQQIHKLVYDRLSAIEENHQTLVATVAKLVPGLTAGQVQSLIQQSVIALHPPPLPTLGVIPAAPPPPPATTCNVDITLGQPAGIPAAPNKRWFRGNFGGIRVPGLPGIPDGPNNTVPNGDTSMLWCPFFNRYPAVWQATAIAAYVARGYTHFEMNWASARDDGVTPAQFVALAQQIHAAGLYPVTELCGKLNPGVPVTDYINIANEIIPPMLAAGVLPIAYMGKELNLRLSPADLQTYIDAISAQINESTGTNLYVHFTSGYMSFQASGPVAAFWNANVGKLTGFLYQQDPSLDCPTLQNDLTGTILSRCAGNDTMPTDTGFGHPVDCVAYELTAEAQFFPPNLSEAQGDLQGFHAICAPAATGPAGTAVVMGFGNGCARPDGTRV